MNCHQFKNRALVVMLMTMRWIVVCICVRVHVHEVKLGNFNVIVGVIVGIIGDYGTKITCLLQHLLGLWDCDDMPTAKSDDVSTAYSEDHHASNENNRTENSDNISNTTTTTSSSNSNSNSSSNSSSSNSNHSNNNNNNNNNNSSNNNNTNSTNNNNNNNISSSSSGNGNNKPVKVIVFSQWTRMLTMMSKAFEMNSISYVQLGGKSLAERIEVWCVCVCATHVCFSVMCEVVRY
jgi:DNA mismatch repair ATPase MutL